VRAFLRTIATALASIGLLARIVFRLALGAVVSLAA
jgi:hypothetical protein